MDNLAIDKTASMTIIGKTIMTQVYLVSVFSQAFHLIVNLL